ncbi:glycoside hydrolase family 43 protein [Jiangella anatolica]|uniref:Glycoside hydrolase n=1 Tax=Jiangella anatolica TaxID=2670374 RepID=A0A2W2C1X3_9ACTN|nr:glycoside hydrolase family 43 protein [Jiangella anatolica]PZF86724.1 glycoside hydrolase [Jiangella anatolica]
MTEPAHPDYFADPFVLAVPGGYAAYGTTPAHPGDVFESLWSPDLRVWEPRGPVLRRPDGLGDEFWAPEVAHADGAYWLYYSVGHGIDGHHLRVARADTPFGPFDDLGVSLTPGERFAIDAHPFRDVDGRWYLFLARDVLDAQRPGTHLAVAPLASMTELAAPPAHVLAPNADWQLYQRDREMYGRRFDWHTLEGPAVVRRNGRYWLTYSGGAWTGPGYAVAWAVADHPLGPWRHAPEGTPPLLATRPGLAGPGHNSIVTGPDGGDVIAFHAWDAAGRLRRLHLHHLTWSETGPRVGGPLIDPSERRHAQTFQHHD